MMIDPLAACVEAISRLHCIAPIRDDYRGHATVTVTIDRFPGGATYAEAEQRTVATTRLA